jgi:protein-tyrosine-phosphatase
MTERSARVLFVCVENSNRSQMAEAFARMHGGSDVEAYSAGSKPSGQVNPRAIAAMRERGYDMTSHRSKSLDDIPQDGYEYVVTMGCGDACPWIPARFREDWDLADPRDMSAAEFAGVRDEIERRVRALLSRMKKGEPKES